MCYFLERSKFEKSGFLNKNYVKISYTVLNFVNQKITIFLGV